jgi:hypothetical protein
MSESCALSVVVGDADAEPRRLAGCVAALRAATAQLDAEIVIAAPADRAERCAARGERGVRVIASDGRFTPQLWRDGLRASRGRVVAFTISQCIVEPAWATGLLRALASTADDGAVTIGAGGSFALDADATVTDAAVCYLRYSAFLDEGREVRAVREIAGDNAAYRRDALERHDASFTDGFWEVDFHRRVRESEPATRLVLIPGAVARFAGAPGLGTVLGARFQHARHFGAWRVATGGRPAWAIVAAAPLVPALLAWRIIRRVWPQARERVRLALAAPALAALACAWAAGEAWGAVRGGPISASHSQTLIA